MVRAEDLPALDWQETIALLSEEMAAPLATPAAALVASAMEREQSEATFLGKGMALPHARVAGLAQAGICVARSVAGINWHEQKAHLIAFLAVPEEAPNLYLQLMSRLVRWRLTLAEAALSSGPVPADWEQELHALLRDIPN